MKEIIFFANGNPESPQTWSNIPACFVKTLRKKGITVHPVSLANEKIEHYYDDYFRKILKILTFWYDNPRYYGYTWLHKWLGNKKIEKTVKKYPQADYCFFINYAFYNKYSPIPTLLLSDWTDEINLQRTNKKPQKFHKRFCKQQKEAIEHAEHTISIFELCAKQMKELYPKGNISFLGGNVINDLSGKSIEETSSTDYAQNIIDKKSKSNRVLFVGKPDRYKESAIKLIEAVGLLRQKEDYKDLEVDIIGIRKDQIPETPDYVICHGFLRKDKEKERETFYSILENAKMIVNPTPKWAAYSSIVEAMSFYTPVIVSPFDDFVNEFGKEIKFGLYNKEFSAACIANNIKSIIEHPNYASLCHNAHDTVKGYTWDAYVEKIIKLIED